LFAVTFRRLLRIDMTAVAQDRRPDLILLRHSVVLALVSYMVQAFFSSNLQKDPLWWLLGFAEALVCMAAMATVPSAKTPATRPLAAAAAKPEFLPVKTG